MYILIYSIKRRASFSQHKKKKNRVILWCLLLYADARGPVEVFVAFPIWTPHFFIHIYVSFSSLVSCFTFTLPPRHNPFHIAHYNPLGRKVYVYMDVIRL